MRLWTLHPAHLDAKGLVALWREALLAQRVLEGATRGYRAHPQLHRFQEHPAPLEAIRAYLRAVHQEALRRGYAFDAARIGGGPAAPSGCLEASSGQLAWEWGHLKDKLARRDPGKLEEIKALPTPWAHPLFRILPGGVAPWEKGELVEKRESIKKVDSRLADAGRCT